MNAAGAILVTRPEPGGGETAARLHSMGRVAVQAPALVLTPRAFTLPPCQAVLVTSRAGARALPPPIPGLPVLAVGAATAEVVRHAGWSVAAAEGTAESLAALVAGRCDPASGPLLLAVGQGYALDLAAALRARGFRVLRRVAYRTTPAAALPDAALSALRQDRVSSVVFHSPRSAACAITLIRAAGLAETLAGLVACAISPRVAAAARKALAPLAFRELRVATRPGEDALLAVLGQDAPDPRG